MSAVSKLDFIAERIRDELHAGTRHAAAAGALLIEAKAAVLHGQWSAWLRDHFAMSERSAQNLMRLARELPKLDAQEAQRVADLPLREALRALSVPRRPGLGGLPRALVAIGTGWFVHVVPSLLHPEFAFITRVAVDAGDVEGTVRPVRWDGVQAFADSLAGEPVADWLELPSEAAWRVNVWLNDDALNKYLGLAVKGAAR